MEKIIYSKYSNDRRRENLQYGQIFVVMIKEIKRFIRRPCFRKANSI